MALTRITQGVIKPNENYVVNNINSSGVTTSTNFKTGTSNLHNVGIEIAGINVLGADTPIGTGATIYNSGAAIFSGDVKVGGALTVGGVLTYEDVTSIDSVGVITARGDISIADKIVHTGDTNTAIRFPAADTITAETGGTERLRILSDGSIGINSTSPAKFVDFVGITDADSQVAFTNSTKAKSIQIRPNDNTIINYGSDFVLNTQTASTNLTFQTGGNERLRITGIGSVGIGTDDPAALLHLQGTGGNTSGLYFKNGPYDAVRQYFNNANDNSDFVITYDGTGGAELTLHATGVLGLNEENGDDVLIGAGSVIGNARLTIGKAAAGFTTAIALHNTGGEGSKIISSRSLVLGADYDNNTGTDGSIIGFETNGTEKLRIASDGKVLIGTNASRSTRIGGSNFEGLVQVESDSEMGFTISRFIGSNGGPRFVLQKARGTAASPAIVQEDDQVAQLLFNGWDGDTFTNLAKINVDVDGTPGDDDMPGRIEFHTTADGAHQTTERLRINSSGQLELRKNQGGVTGRPENRIVFRDLDPSVDANQPIGEISWYSTDAGMVNVNSYIRGINEATNGSGALLFGVKAAGSSEIEALRITSDGKVGISETSPQALLHLNDGANSAIMFGNTTNGYKIRANVTSSNDYGLLIEDEDGVDLYRATSSTGTANANTHTFFTGGSERLQIESSGLVLPQTSNEIRTDSSDGSDNKRIIIAGGGDNSQSRGAQIAIYGNEYSSHQGRLQLLAGNSGNTNGVVEIYTGGLERLHLEADGDLRIGKDDSNYGWIRGFSGTTGDMIFDADKSTSGSNGSNLIFRTRGSEKLRITSAGKVGIGTDNPDELLSLGGTASEIRLRIDSQGYKRNNYFGVTAADNVVIAADEDNAGGSSSIRFRIDNTEKVRITSGGKVGIGTDSPSSFLHVAGSGYETLKLENTDNGADGPYIEFFNNSTSPADNDYIGILNFKGRNDNNEEINFAGIRGRSSDVSDGTEDGTLSFHTRLNGTYTQQILLRQDGDVVLTGSQVNKDVDTSSWVLAGGTDSNVGGNITLYGSNHSSMQNIIRFRNSATEAMRINGDGDVCINRDSNSSSNSMLHISSHDVTTKYNNDNVAQVAFLIDTHHSGTEALSGNRSKIGIRMDMEYSGTGTKTNTSGARNSLYGIHCSVDSTKDTYTSYGGYFYSNCQATDQAYSTISYGVYGYGRNYSIGGSNRSATIAGGYFLGYRGGDINAGHCYGVYARAQNINNTGDNSGDLTGVYAEAEMDKDVTVTNAYAFRGYLDRDAGTITNSYILYGSHGGDSHFSNRWGIHISDCAKSYLGGNLTITGALSKGSGSFRIPHPLVGLSTTKDLVHSFIEGPQCDLIYRGKVDLVGGTATINIDTKAGMTEGTFVTLCRDIQCFTSNETGWTAVKGSVTGNKITIIAQDNSCTDTISWMVVGERQDDNIKESELTDADGNLIVEPDKRTDIIDKYQAEEEKNEYNIDPNHNPGDD